MSIFHTTIGAYHTLFALLAMVSGTYVILTIKGDIYHKKVGYFYVFSMIVMNISALFTQSLFVFGPFHYLALFSLCTVIFGMIWPILLRHKANWMYWHFQAMAWSYVGLWAAFFSEVIVRLPFVEFGLIFGVVVGATSFTVVAIGGYFIVQYKNKWRKQLLTD